MKKKFLGISLAVVLAVGLLGGCGKADSGSNSRDNAGTAASNDTGAGDEKEYDGEVTKVVCGTTTGYYPCVYTDEDENLIGYDIELITAVFDRLPQYELEFQLNDWDAVLTGLDSGLYQISTECIFYSESRAEKYYFSDPIFYDPEVVVAAADSPDIATFDDLAGKTVPGRAGDIWASALESYNEDHADNPIIIDYTESDFFQLFVRAEAGEIVFVSDYAMVTGMLSRNDFNVRVQTLDADYTSQYLGGTYTYFLMSRYGDEAAELRDAVNEALAEVMADGTAQQISQKYFGEDYTPVNN